MTPSEITFRHVPAGSITLKNARAGAVRDVVLQAFQLAETPVTVAQYAGEAGNSRADRPVTPITWFDAIRWCNAASDAEGLSPAYTIADDWAFWNPAADGYRLPTEAEWEFACRAGTTGPTYGPLSEIAWTEADGVDSPQPVATKQPNDFGLYDMLGNVWEWCWDLADPARYGVTEAFGAGAGLILRGAAGHPFDGEARRMPSLTTSAFDRPAAPSAIPVPPTHRGGPMSRTSLVRNPADPFRSVGHRSRTFRRTRSDRVDERPFPCGFHGA